MDAASGKTKRPSGCPDGLEGFRRSAARCRYVVRFRCRRAGTPLRVFPRPLRLRVVVGIRMAWPAAHERAALAVPARSTAKIVGFIGRSSGMVVVLRDGIRVGAGEAPIYRVLMESRGRLIRQPNNHAARGVPSSLRNPSEHR